MKPQHPSPGSATEIHSQLQQAFDHFNEALFQSALPRCVITIQSNHVSPACLVPNGFLTRHGDSVDMIVMSPWFFQAGNDEFVLAALVHEMCHLWQRKFGTPGRVRYHNAEWAAKMRSLGLIPTHNGQTGGRPTGDSMQQRIQQGGSFEYACSQLLNTGYEIGWHKPFPPMPGGGRQTDAGTGAPRNRLKYTCACFTNIWAKPGVVATCGACRSRFISGWT